MTPPAPSAPRIFVSYSHKDDAFTRRLVDRLHAAGAEVWVDIAGISHGNFMQRIDEALARCEWMVLVLTPNAIASEYVKDEVYAALHRVKQGYMRDVIPVLAAACDPRAIPPTWDVLHRYDATCDERTAFESVLRAVWLPVAPPPSPAAARSSDPPLRRPAPTRQAQTPVAAAPFPLSSDQVLARLADLGFTSHTIGTVEVIIPPLCAVSFGAFLMGSDPKHDTQASDNEKPRHRVTVGAFQIARFPVTVAEHACFVHAGHSPPPRGMFVSITWQDQMRRMDQPVISVSWHDATAYAAWLAQQTGHPWRLPTEAEWEKAARWDAASGHARLYPWGDTFDASHANTSQGGPGCMTPVGSYPGGASPYGAQDMAGNVWEWTSSVYQPYPYSAADGRERADSTDERVLRGGSGSTVSTYARAAYRDAIGCYDFLGIGGFRLASGPAGTSA